MIRIAVRLVAYPIGLVVAFGGIWTLLEPLGLIPGWPLWINVFLGANALYFVGLCIDMHIATKNRIHTFSHLADPYILLKLFARQTEVRIFASGSETYRNSIIPILSKLELNKRMRIKVLVRDDGTPSRKEKIAEARRKWTSDIDNNSNITTEIRAYESSISLRGIVFGTQTAVLGWYFVSTKETLGQRIPATVYSSDIPEANEVIEFAIKTFDGIFENARQV